MDRELLQEYFRKSEFSDVQSEALSRILADMKETFATKEDLAVLKADLKGEMAALRSELLGEMGRSNAHLEGKMGAWRADLEGKMGAWKSDLEGKMGAWISDLEGKMAVMSSDLEGKMAVMSSEIRGEMAALRAGTQAADRIESGSHVADHRHRCVPGDGHHAVERVRRLTDGTVFAYGEAFQRLGRLFNVWGGCS